MQDLECIRKGQGGFDRATLPHHVQRLASAQGEISCGHRDAPAAPPPASIRLPQAAGPLNIRPCRLHRPGDPREGYYRDLYLLWVACGMLRLADWAGAVQAVAEGRLRW